MENLTTLNIYSEAANDVARNEAMRPLITMAFFVFVLVVVVGMIGGLICTIANYKTEKAKVEAEKTRALASYMSAAAQVKYADEKAKDAVLLNINREILAKAKLSGKDLNTISQSVNKQVFANGDKALEEYNALLQDDDEMLSDLLNDLLPKESPVE